MARFSFQFDVRSPYYQAMVTEAQAIRALRIGLEHYATRHADIRNDFWDAIDKEFAHDLRPEGVMWVVLADDAVDRYLKASIAAITKL